MAQIAQLFPFLLLSIFLSLPLLRHVAADGSLSRHCLENPPTLNSSYGAGSVKQIGGLKAYVSGHYHSKRAILLVSDVYGYEAPHLRKIADKVARSGFYAVVPDFFFGDPYVANTSRTIPVWLKIHGTDKGFEDAKPVIAALKQKGIHAIGAAGFCWGGNVVTKIAKTNLIKAAVLLHPSWVTVDDIKAVKVPIAILAAELDNGTPAKQLEEFKSVLSQDKVKNFIKIYPNVKHGWTVRYNDTDATAVKAANEAHKDLLHWSTKYVKKR
ncbi:endo-1,3;1,4-beta-D-glucanase-like [Corylus avellana]|uniref:endo-1,3;1,4-beta-D-glucanase-like n=1 Tax=Corylus avellana TaxID=13451 RepID=UPI001E223030|nr:endo-1,3;1,4-beta-D-glucanase-like [Corylus avellana]